MGLKQMGIYSHLLGKRALWDVSLEWIPMVFRARKATCWAILRSRYCHGPTYVSSSSTHLPVSASLSLGPFLSFSQVQLSEWEASLKRPEINNPQIALDQWLLWLYEYPGSLSSGTAYLRGAGFALFPRVSLGMMFRSPTRKAALIEQCLWTVFSSMYYFSWSPTGIPSTSWTNVSLKSLSQGLFLNWPNLE